jgi:hypothetical protein
MTNQDPMRDDRLTLESLLSDPLTQLVMRADRITAADTQAAFLHAQAGLAAQARAAELYDAGKRFFFEKQNQDRFTTGSCLSR